MGGEHSHHAGPLLPIIIQREPTFRLFSYRKQSRLPTTYKAELWPINPMTPGEVFPILDNAGRLHLKGAPFSGRTYIKGEGFQELKFDIYSGSSIESGKYNYGISVSNTK